MKKRLSVISFIFIICIVYYQMNYKTLEEAIKESNVPMDEIFYTTEMKGNTIIIYGDDNNLSAGLIEKSFFGYRWSGGAGGEEFNRNDSILTKSFTNLLPRRSSSIDDYVTIAMGVINDDEIEKLLVQYKNVESTEATILDTKRGRIWFSFSQTPINYDPEVIRIYKDGTKISGWY
ncbi:hypothetical protein [Psychrobacillus sp. L4]|uniref:hypothetical protein n=1 Tax=Psychrobacillus sp. L4 TaxID=3236892 RepID=UPI0036F24FA9